MKVYRGKVTEEERQATIKAKEQQTIDRQKEDERQSKERQAVWGAQVDRIRYLISASLDVLEEDLKDIENKQLRQKAAIHILQAVGLYGQNLKPDGEDTPEGVEAQKRHEEVFRELTMLG